MTLREQLHERIEHLDEGLLQNLLSQLNKIEKQHSTKVHTIEDTIALWQALAEPIQDEEAKSMLEQEMQRRPLFGDRPFDVLPD